MIVITAPTSNIGSQLLENLLSSGESIRIIARDPSRLPAATRERVEVVVGSHSDAAVVNEAFAGADTVFWLVPSDPGAKSAEASYVDFARPGCAAFKSAGVKRVVGISALGRGWPRYSGYVSATLAMDDLVASTGVSYRALACPGFMENMLRQVQPIKSQGVFYSPILADLKLPTCATRDIAAVATRLLLDRSWSGVDSVPVLGPEDLSANDMAQIMTEVLGKPVRCQETPLDVLKTGLISSGFTAGMAEALAAMMEAKSEGMDNAVPRTPEGTTPTSFRQWCEEVLKPAVLN